MNKHTPGPWEVFRPQYKYPDGQEREGGLSVRRAGDLPAGSRYRIAVITTKSYQQGRGRPDEGDYANAYLIAAAPDLLEVLETIENDTGLIPAWLWDRMQAAIRKAKGGTT